MRYKLIGRAKNKHLDSHEAILEATDLKSAQKEAKLSLMDYLITDSFLETKKFVLSEDNCLHWYIERTSWGKVRTYEIYNKD